MTRTTKDVLQELDRRGISVAAWARHHGFNPTAVYQVLHAPHLPLRGKRHRIAVALGLKDGCLEQDFDLMRQAAG